MISTLERSLPPAESADVRAKAWDEPCPDAGERLTTVGSVGARLLRTARFVAVQPWAAELRALA